MGFFCCKKNITEDEKFLKLYELYLQRITTEYNLMWSRFKIYLSLNGGVIASLGFVIGKKEENVHLNSYLGSISEFIYLICFIGFLFSIIWYLINVDSQKWQKLMNETLVQYEKKLSLDDKMGLYTEIENKWQGNNKFGFDVVQINNLLPCILVLIWVLLFFIMILGHINVQ